jgi:hypothetical protein
MVAVNDGGNNDFIRVKEFLPNPDTTGMWARMGIALGGWVPPDANFRDLNGYDSPIEITTQVEAIKFARKLFLDPKSKGHDNENQMFKFVALAVDHVHLGGDRQPDASTKGYVIKKSGFWFSIQTPVKAFPEGWAKELVWRTAEANNGAQAGLLEGSAAPMFDVAI